MSSGLTRFSRSGPVCWSGGLYRNDRQEGCAPPNRVVPIDQGSDYDGANYFFINDFPSVIVNESKDSYNNFKTVIRVNHFRTFDLELTTCDKRLSLRHLNVVVHNSSKEVLQFSPVI